MNEQHATGTTPPAAGRSRRPRASIPPFLLLPLLPLLLVTGCATGGGGAEDEPDIAELRSRQAVLRIDNNEDLAMHVDLLTETKKFHVGTLRSFSSERFEVPTSIVGAPTRIVLRADPIGSARIHRSAEIVVSAGDVVDWDIGPGVQRSLNSIRVRSANSY